MTCFFIDDGKVVPYERLLLTGAPTEPKVDIKETDLASINFSSGTTGRPKGVMLSQKSWVNSFYNYIINSPKAREGSIIILHCLSFATAGGTMFLPAVVLGIRNIILRKFNTKKAVDLMLKHNVNTTFITPSIFIDILGYVKKKDIRLSLKGIVLGTEPVAQAVFKECIECFGPIIQEGYGMVEVLPPLCLLCSHDYIKDGKLDEALLLSVGKALRRVGLKITDGSGNVLPIGKAGRIAVKSNTLSAGYWKTPELTKKHYKDKWFHTNDYGYIDASGYLYILGREHDILREEPDMVFSREIEEVLYSYPDIAHVCVFKSEKKIIACISLKADNNNISEEKLYAFCKARLGGSKMPEIFKTYDKLPKNASCKLDRKQIKENFEKGGF